MKKIILMLSVVVCFVCLFAISVSAVEVGGIYYSIEGSGENAYACVSAQNRTDCTLERVEIPATIKVDGVTYKVKKIAENAFGIVNGDPNKFIKHLVIGENVSVVTQHAFRRVTSLETVVIKNTNAETPINFNNAQFMGCTNLKSVDAKEAKISAYGGNCFDGCSSLETIDYPDMLTSLGYASFKGCEKLTNGDLSNTQITSIGGWSFGSCKSITNFKFPSTLTSIGNNCFLYCPVETYVFPHGVKTFGGDTLAHQSVIKVVVMPEADEKTSLSGFLHSVRPNVIIYPGDNIEYFVSLYSAFSSYDLQPFDQYVPGTTYAKNTIFYGAKTCDACNGLLGEKGFIFTDLITDMKIGQECTHCDNENITQRYAPVFEDLGYSTFELNGFCSIAQGFKINYDSLDVYNTQFADRQVTTYGALVVADRRVDGVAFDDEGVALEGVSSYEIKTKLDYFDIRVINISSDGMLDENTAYTDAKLHLCAYVVVGDEIYYITENYVGTTLGQGVSYNDKRVEE